MIPLNPVNKINTIYKKTNNLVKINKTNKRNGYNNIHIKKNKTVKNSHIRNKPLNKIHSGLCCAIRFYDNQPDIIKLMFIN